MSNEKALADWIVGARDEELVAGIIVMADALRERSGVTFTWPPKGLWVDSFAGVPWSAPEDNMPDTSVTEQALLADEDLKEALTSLAKEWTADEASHSGDDYRMGWVTIDAVGEWLRHGHYPNGAEVRDETADALNEYALRGYDAEAVGRRVLALVTA